MKILVGAGWEAPEWSAKGWTCNDLGDAAALYSDIALVGPCWALPVPDASATEIMAKGMFEHMTYHEAARALAEWRRVLAPGGHVTVEVPDVDEYVRQYAAMLAEGGDHPEGRDGGAEGEPDDISACTGIDRWLRRALWGWQRYPGDEHRSGWTERLLAHYLDRYFGGRCEIRRMAVSFDEDAPVSRVRHLWARAWKTSL